MPFLPTSDICLQLQKSMDLLTSTSRVTSRWGWLKMKKQRKLQEMIIVSRTHPLMGRRGRCWTDQVLAFHEIPIIGHASFERQRRRDVCEVGTRHAVQFQICENQHLVNSSITEWNPKIQTPSILMALII